MDLLRELDNVGGVCAAASVDLCFDKSTMDCILHAANGVELVKNMVEEVGWRCMQSVV